MRRHEIFQFIEINLKTMQRLITFAIALSVLSSAFAGIKDGDLTTYHSYVANKAYRISTSVSGDRLSSAGLFIAYPEIDIDDGGGPVREMWIMLLDPPPYIRTAVKDKDELIFTFTAKYVGTSQSLSAGKKMKIHAFRFLER